MIWLKQKIYIPSLLPFLGDMGDVGGFLTVDDDMPLLRRKCDAELDNSDASLPFKISPLLSK